ncbi:hypothetical protein CRUP_027789 [Coryphaenoides rupestris]|nr:hypothetical protein CRUP_027789 [Coryphaenoides rupestris]
MDRAVALMQDPSCTSERRQAEWPREVFTEGITNRLTGCYVGSLHEPGSCVLVRVYGRNTELYVDRQREVEMFQVLHAHGCGPLIFCTFHNGICYEFN